ncbi:hypothetical protein [Actinoplanes solisilvae]|uniref:hypothetical protein n=1 Tax=Actinoplanes solisilvae TaxID=2486853 RepID=UPI000FDC5CD4|nr:hypothetical protein [Actinoplanes solisilvae]
MPADADTVVMRSVREYGGKVRHLADHRESIREWLMLTVLTLMAAADAYGFWSTLTKLFKRDTYFVMGFVAAIALGTVAAAHEMGRLARSRREGYGGSLVWMAALAIVWLGVGSTIVWLRAQDPIISGGNAKGRLAGSVAAGASDDSVRVAILLLALYLLTGLLAMTHAYQYRDPRSAELRDAQKDRERIARVAAERKYEAYLAKQGMLAQQELARLHQESRDRSVGEKEFLGQALHEQSAQDIARHLHNPSATDGLIPPPPPPPAA